MNAIEVKRIPLLLYQSCSFSLAYKQGEGGWGPAVGGGGGGGGGISGEI